jgi:hypothetical protein
MGHLEREHVHLLLIADAQRGLADIEEGLTYGADDAIDQLQQRRQLAPQGPCASPFMATA